MKHRAGRIALLLVLAAVLIAGGVYAAVRYGTRDDPLVTMSYLTDVVEQEITEQTDASIRDAVSAAQKEIRQDLSEQGGGFHAVRLTAGQTLRCELGAELLLTDGSAVTAGAFTDTTAGEALAPESAVPANHLLLASEDGAALKASGDVILMVRGEVTLAG